MQFINFINQFIKRNLFFFAKRTDMLPMLSHHSAGHGSWTLVSCMRRQYSTIEPPIHLFVSGSFSIKLYFCFREVSCCQLCHVFINISKQLIIFRNDIIVHTVKNAIHKIYQMIHASCKCIDKINIPMNLFLTV